MDSNLKNIVFVLAVVSIGLMYSCGSDDSEAVRAPSSVSFDETSLVVAENGNAQAIVASLDVPAIAPTTVTISIASDNATYGEDFTTTPDGSSGSMSFEVPAGEETISFMLTPVDNEAIDADKQITFTPTSIGGAGISGASGITVFIESDEVSTLLLKEDFDNLTVVDNGLNNAFISNAWIQVNGNGQVFSEGDDRTLGSFVGNGVGGALTFDNTADSPTGTTFLNLTRRFLDSDVTTSLDEQTYVPNTYYAAFNFTLDELDVATPVRRYVSLGKIIYDGDKTLAEASAIASEWGAKMAIKGIQEDGVQKYMFGLHKRIGSSGIFGDLVVPDAAPLRDLGTTYLVVLKVEQTDNVESDQGEEPTAAQSNSKAYLYVFAEGEDYSTEPATPYAEDAVGGDVNINAIVLLGDQNNHAATFDGIRVANDWRSLFSE